MSFVSNVFGGLLGRQAVEDSAEHPAAPPPPPPPHQPLHVIFDDRDRAEARLARRWRDCQAAAGCGQGGRNAVNQFFEAFNEAFADWQPEALPQSLPSPKSPQGRKRLSWPGVGALGPATVRRGSSGPSDGGHAVATTGSQAAPLRGCAAGHPHDVLAALVAALRGVPQELAQAMRREAADAAAAGAGVRLAPLDAVGITSRSVPNRATLLAAGLLPALAGILDAAISRLNALAAVLGVQAPSGSTAAQLAFLQGAVRRAAAPLAALAATELRAAASEAAPQVELAQPPAALAPPGAPQYHSALPLEPGTAAQAAAMEAAAAPFLAAGLLQRLLETARLLALIRQRGGLGDGGGAAAAVLEAVAVLASGSAAARAAVTTADESGRSRLQLLTEAVGWPTSPATATGGGAAAEDAELRLQLTTLQLVGLAVRRDAASLQGFQAAGGLTRITSLLQWAALTFGGTVGGAAEARGNAAQQNAEAAAAAAATPPADASGAHQLSDGTGGAVTTAGTASPASAAAPASHAAHASNPVNPVGGPRLPLLPSPLRTPATSRRLGSSQPHHAALPSSPPAHPPPTALQRLDSARPADAALPLPPSRQLAELFAVLAGMLQLHDSGAHSSTWDGLVRCVLGAVLDAFRPPPPAPADARPAASQASGGAAGPASAGGGPAGAGKLHTLNPERVDGAELAAFFRQRSTALQHHTLALLGRVLHVDPTAIHAMRGAALWELAYGPAFFFFGQDVQGSATAAIHVGNITPGLAAAQQQTAAAASGAPAAASPPDTQLASHPDQTPSGSCAVNLSIDEESGQVSVALRSGSAPLTPKDHVEAADAGSIAIQHVAAARAALRERVVLLTRAAAAAGPETNEVECGKLLDLVGGWACDAGVVLLAAPALQGILATAPFLTAATFAKFDVLAVLAAAAVKQAEAAAAQAVDEDAASQSWQARAAVLHLMAATLEQSPAAARSALRHEAVLAVLFGFLRRPLPRRLALHMLGTIMAAQPASDAARAAKAALFGRVVEALPGLLVLRPAQGLAPVLQALESVRALAAGPNTAHQNLFRRAGVLVQLVNLLNDEFAADEGTQLACGVLRTLAALLAGNDSARKRLSHDVGADTLLALVLRLSPGGQPPQQLLHAILTLALEAEHDEAAVPPQHLANVDAVPLFLATLRAAGPPERRWGLALWASLLRDSMANLSACDRSGVSGLLIEWFAASTGDPPLQEHIAALLQAMGAYSIAGRDLRALLALLRPAADGGSVPRHSPLLLSTLGAMAAHSGPAAFFDFGDGGAGIMRSAPLRMPTKGYSFATWLRVDEAPQPRSAQPADGPGHPGAASNSPGRPAAAAEPDRALYSMLSRDAAGVKGICALLRGTQLVLQTFAGKAALPSEATLAFDFSPRQWYHVVVAHAPRGPLSAPLATLYVDGQPVAAAEKLRYPKVPEGLSACSFAAALGREEAGAGAPLAAFRGQMAAIYLFDVALSAEKTAALHALGPDYQSAFSAAESSAVLEQAGPAAAAVLEGRDALGPRLLAAYNAQAAAGRALFDTAVMDRSASASGGGGGGAASAALLERTQLCHAVALRGLLPCLGGVRVLLPLVSLLDLPAPGDDADQEESRAPAVFALLTAVLLGCPTNRQAFAQLQGPALLGWLLQQRTPRHLTLDLLRGAEGLLRATAAEPPLQREVLASLLLELRLWAAAPVAVQRSLFALCLKLSQGEPELMQHLFGVPRMLDALRAHYGMAASPDAMQPAAGAYATPEELRALRCGLLEAAAALVHAAAVPLPPRPLEADGSTTAEVAAEADAAHHLAAAVQALASFIGDCTDEALAEDAVGALAALLPPAEAASAPVAAALQRLGGLGLVAPLLRRPRQALRVAGLRAMAALLPLVHGAQELEGFWAEASEALLLFPLTPPTRRALLQLMHATPAADPNQGGGGGGAHAAAVLLQLLRGCEDAGERVAALQGLVAGLVEGPRASRAAFAALPGWEQLLLDLLLDGAPGIPPQDGLAEGWMWRGPEMAATRRLLRVMAVHCLRCDAGGAGCLRRLAAAARAASARGVLNGWALMHEVVADVVDELLGSSAAAANGESGLAMSSEAAAAADAWMLVSELGTQPYRDNALELLKIIDELTARTLIEPNPAAELSPGASAAAWAEEHHGQQQRQRGGRGGAEGADAAGKLQTPAEAWVALGVQPQLGDPEDGPNSSHLLLPGCWRLYGGAWQFLAVLQRAADGLASLSPPSTPRLSPQHQEALPAPPSSLMRVLEALDVAAAQQSPAEAAAAARAAAGGRADTERPLRLAVRVLLLYLQHSSLDGARRAASQAGQLLPALLGAHLHAGTEAGGDRAQWLLAALLRARQESATGRQLPEGTASAGVPPEDVFPGPRFRLIDQVVEGVAQAVRPALAAGLPVELQARLAGTPHPTSGQVATLLQPECVARCAASEVLALDHWAHATEAALRDDEAAAQRRQLAERSALAAFWEASREATGLLVSAERSRRAAARAAAEERAQELAGAWRAIWRGLSGDVGLWADPNAASDQHWKRDKAEDASRRRRRLRRNFGFRRYEDAPRGGAPAPGPPPPDPLPSPLPAGMPKRTLVESEDEADDAMDAVAEASNDASAEPDPQAPSTPAAGGQHEQRRDTSAAAAGSPPGAPDPRRQCDGRRWSWMEGGDAGQPPDGHNFADSFLQEDQVTMCAAASLITPRAVVPGRLDVSAAQLHFVGDPPTADASTGAAQAGRVHKRWACAELAAVHHARYLLRPAALELFMADRSNALLNFASPKSARDVATAIVAASGAAEVDRKRRAEAAARLAGRWARWELSSFDYLMQLNTLAGRTYNDLNQYPVFPWVIADYQSEALDLTNPATFRDLGKPIGALDPKRLSFFKERFEGMRDDPDGVPPFHYGSHYSSAGIVLFWLLRQEPFTGLARELQGGHFDHADRLFSSVAAAWRGCLEGTSDVKELVPEFFYDPEFLRNADGHALGTRQDGVVLGDVELPPWAHGSPDAFVRLQREALECDHVSERLHQWIDLIFGFQQRGKAAEEAANTFYYLTYEGTVDLDEVDDPLQRRAIEDQISHFGQTPAQLFRRRHPRRGPPPPAATQPLLNAPDAMRILSVGVPPTRRPNIAVAALAVTAGRAVAVNADRALSAHRWAPPSGAFTFSAGGAAPPEAPFALEPDPLPPRVLGAPCVADLEGAAWAQRCAVLPGGRALATCAYWDCSVRVHSVEEGRLLQAAARHQDIATCVTCSPCGCFLASGSRDTTVIVWDVCADATATGGARRGRGGGARDGSPMPLQPAPRHVLAGHSDVVTCLAVDSGLDLVISAAADGVLLMHTLRTGRYVRTLWLESPPAWIMLAPEAGALVTHSHADLALRVFTINGRPLVAAEGTERLAAAAATADGRFLLTGGAKGSVRLRWLHSLQVVLTYEVNQGPITAIVLTPEQCFLVGTATGALAAFAPDPRRRITRRLPLTDDSSAGAATSRRSGSSSRLNSRGSSDGGSGRSSSGGGHVSSSMTAASGTRKVQ